MTLDNFKIILKKLDGYTKYLYLHVLGEPLLHPLINEFIDEAYNNSFNVNITSNGYLIDRIKTKNIRQLNVSLHSFFGDESAFVKYLNKILDKADDLDKTYISLRFWVKSDFLDLTLYIINNRYHTNITLKKLEKQHSIRVNNHIFINLFHEFIWPDLNNTKSSSKGTCYALRDHFGILVRAKIDSSEYQILDSKLVKVEVRTKFGTPFYGSYSAQEIEEYLTGLGYSQISVTISKS
jgi:hypothetical protein